MLSYADTDLLAYSIAPVTSDLNLAAHAPSLRQTVLFCFQEVKPKPDLQGLLCTGCGNRVLPKGAQASWAQGLLAGCWRASCLMGGLWWGLQAGATTLAMALWQALAWQSALLHCTLRQSTELLQIPVAAVSSM